jgi:hypothetical protein
MGYDRRRGKQSKRKVSQSIVSSDEPPVVKPTLATRLATLALWECVPETEGLVPCARDNCFPIGTHREVEDTTCVAGERRNHVQRWVLPYADLVLGCSRGIAMRRDNLV